MSSSPITKKCFLILGCYGLLGRLSSQALTNLFGGEYNIVGIDIVDSQTSGRLIHEGIKQIPANYPQFLGKMFKADISNLEELDRVFANIIKNYGEIEIVFNMAGSLESNSSEAIHKSNIIGVTNVCKLCNKYRISNLFHSSSVMTLWDFYQKKKANPSDPNQIKLVEREFVDMDFKWLNSADCPYIESKFIGNQIVRESKLLVIAPNIAEVNSANKPTNIYLSHNDFKRLIIVAVRYFQKHHRKTGFINFNAASKNSLFDITNPIGFEPQDFANAK